MSSSQLIVGSSANGDGADMIFDIYTIYNGEIIRVASGGERDHFSVGDNVIEEQGFGNEPT